MLPKWSNNGSGMDASMGVGHSQYLSVIHNLCSIPKVTYNLELNGLSVNINGSDFLQYEVNIPLSQK